MAASQVSPRFGYIIAALAVAVTLTIRLFLSHLVATVPPFLLFILPVFFSAWFFGRAPGLFATGLSAVVIQYFFIPPANSFYVNDVADLVPNVLFIAEGAVMSLFAAAKKQSEEDLERRVLARTNERAMAREQQSDTDVFASLGIAIAKIAHEIAGPLTSISSSLQLYERYLSRQDRQPDERTAHLMRDLKDEVSRLSRLLEELRQFSKPLQLEPSAVQVKTVVEALEIEKLVAKNLSGITVEQHFPPDLPAVMADPEKLKMVLANLIRNSVEAMPNGGRLILRAYRSGQLVCFEVEDTGVGIPQDIHVFQPFTSTKAKGWGLGLAIAGLIIDAHKGTIEYTTEVGRGTVFKICLPLAT